MMMNWTVRSRRLAMCLGLGLWLGACGGGGSGGGGGASALSLGPPTPASASFELAEGTNTPGLNISSALGGDLAALNGKTLYVRVDDPLGLFHSASVTYDAASARASLSLTGRQQTQAGSRSGRLSLQVCFDAQCLSPAVATPLTLGYSVTVRAGLRVAPTTLSLSAAFGSVPAPAALAVTVPEGVAAGSFRFSLLPPASGSAHGAMTLTRAADGSLQVLGRLMPPGRYESTAYIEAIGPAIGQQPAQPYGMPVPLVYEVLDSAAAWGFAPTALVLSTEAGNPAVVPILVDHIARQGYFTLDSWRYDNSADPAGAAASPQYNRWLNLGGSQWAAAGCSSGDCLPPGSYRAVLSFSHRIDGAATGTQVELPVSFEIR